jgi:NAD+ kinase
MKFAAVGLFGKYQDPSVHDSIDQLREHLQGRGVGVFIGETTSSEIEGPRISVSREDLSAVIDLAIIVGGDGTMLHVARELTDRVLPVVGVNLGRLGFLTDIPASCMLRDIDHILDGDFRVEHRMMLDVEVTRDGTSVYTDFGLNDIVLSKGEIARLIESDTFVDDEFVTRTRGDGVVIATPTGSTAYALSAGGPILEPTLPAIALVPICPHTLTHRPLVLEHTSRIRIEPVDLTDGAAYVSVDGFIRHTLASDEHIHVHRSDKTVRLLRPQTHDHFAALRTKLGWGTLGSNNSGYMRR